jgi:hypothetical protein
VTIQTYHAAAISVVQNFQLDYLCMLGAAISLAILLLLFPDQTLT